MKFIFKLFIIFNLAFNLLGLKIKKDIVQVVDRRPPEYSITSMKMTPYVTTMGNQSPFNSYVPEKNYIDIYNSNTNNAPNVTPYTKSAEIVTPHVDFRTNSVVYAATDSPAIIGARKETSTITSLDKRTGKVSRNVIENEKPILGRVTGLEEFKKTERVSYDVMKNTFSEGPTTLTAPDKDLN